MSRGLKSCEMDSRKSLHCYKETVSTYIDVKSDCGESLIKNRGKLERKPPSLENM